MSGRMIRIQKEARALFWPWCAVMSAGMLPVLFPHSATAADIDVLSFFLGAPLLATLSLGNEFHHRTFALWLTQPSSRMQLWVEKMGVMFLAVLSAGLVSGMSMFLFALPEMNLGYNKAAAAVYILITIASATYWTLATRSTAGGFVLIGCVFWSLYLFIGQIERHPSASDMLHTVSLPTAAILAISAFSLCFASLMLWLGARKLERFQATGGRSGEDLLLAGPSLMPEVLAGWFRCRRSGAILNLIRKEFRLLRPVWLIELPIVLYLGGLAVFRLLPSPPEVIPRTAAEWALLGPVVATCVGLAGVSGILSLGEERRSGTQAWHLTLPVSARRLWLIKLVVGMFSGLACVVLLPVLTMIAVGSVYGSPYMFVDLSMLPNWLILYPLLIFSCFWCACAGKGTVDAAIWTVPATAAIWSASSVGMWLGQELARRAGTLKDFTVSFFHLSPVAFTSITDFARTHVLWLFVPALLLALIQSYRLFRTTPQGGAVWVLRFLLPLAIVTSLWSFSASAGFLSSRWEPFEETRHALDKLQPSSTTLDFAGQDLDKSTPLSAPTRRWLSNAHITVVPNQSPESGYLATIHLASGTKCKLIVTRHGGTAASCGN